MVNYSRILLDGLSQQQTVFGEPGKITGVYRCQRGILSDGDGGSHAVHHHPAPSAGCVEQASRNSCVLRSELQVPLD